MSKARETRITREDSMIPSREDIRHQVQLSWAKAVRMAWRNIRVRLGRSLLVTSGIILAIAFLSYILVSDALVARPESTPVEKEQAAPSTRAAGAQEQAPLPPAVAEQSEEAADDEAQTVWMIALALMVSFVGVLNAMLLSVTERYAEIGTMKCLGALDSLIVKLFLLESLFQGLVGAAAGLAIGTLLAVVETWPCPGASPGEVAKLLAFCFGSGVLLTLVGALYPAWRAAHMKPVEAMRSEV